MKVVSIIISFVFLLLPVSAQELRFPETSNEYLAYFMPKIIDHGLCIYPDGNNDLKQLFAKENKILLCMQYNDSLLIIPTPDFYPTYTKVTYLNTISLIEHLIQLYKGLNYKIKYDGFTPLNVTLISEQKDTIQYYIEGEPQLWNATISDTIFSLSYIKNNIHISDLMDSIGIKSIKDINHCIKHVLLVRWECCINPQYHRIFKKNWGNYPSNSVPGLYIECDNCKIKKIEVRDCSSFSEDKILEDLYFEGYTKIDFTPMVYKED